MNNPAYNRNAQAGMSEQEQQTMAAVKALQTIMESCPGKTAMAGVAGFALGGVFGLFMASMSYDSTMTPASQAISTLSTREQIKVGFKDMGARSLSSAKNFGKIGAIFSASECVIEGYRAKNDLANGVAAGCVTGAILGIPAGPYAAGMGCAGFAVFSAAVDYYMRLPAEKD